MILLAVACLVFVSCGPRTEKATEVTEETTCCELTPEQEADWANWDNLDLERQTALIGEVKAFFDDCHAKCEAKCEAAKEEGAVPEEVCPEKEAKRAEFKAKWDAFDTMTLEEQKALLDQAFECKAKCCHDKEAEEAPVQE